MPTFRDFITALRKLEVPPSRPIIVHASLSAFGEVHGGAQTILGTLLACFNALIAPAFTFKTLVIPEAGPPDNAVEYGSGKDLNRMAEFFHPGMPADRLMGVVAEALRTHPWAHRSAHPVLSFTGINSDPALEAQTVAEPLAPIGVLADQGGWVLLVGVDQRANTCIHYAERCAGRKGFIRWSLTSQGVIKCPGFPGCSEGFEALTPRLQGVSRKAWVGPGLIQAIPLVDLLDITKMWIQADPLALLCNRKDCQRCNAVRCRASPV